ncbi:MAG: cytochrome o ubiquinol oxidase subunit IV [Gammaproteobacteria bacterium]|nr:cytochrome o ubiquinol oxidase subunit IV [Gammaproteobacteria bacterium]
MEIHKHSLKKYLIGFMLAAILTLIPFWVVWFGSLSARFMFLAITISAVAQILVHLRYFLNISFKHTAKDYLTALVFAGVLIFIMVGGTIWILFDLNFRMM